MTRIGGAALCLAGVAMLVGAVAAACANAEASRTTREPQGPPPASAGEIGVPGAAGDLVRVRLALPAGATSTAITLTAEAPPGLYPQLIIVRAEPASPLSSEALLTLPYSDDLVRTWGIADETQLGVFQRNHDGTWWWTPALVDPATNTVVLHVTALGTWAVGPSWMMKPWQQGAVLGAGFEPDTRNALVVHGWNSEPWDACQLQLAEGLAPYYDNIAAVAYPSALDIAANANWLRAEIERRWSDAPFDIIAFSEGGLVARAAIEPHAWNGDVPIAARIGRLVTIATPHSGIESDAPLSLLNDEAARQMRPGSEFLRRLNGAPSHAGVRYQLIAGDLGRGSDGIVPVESALGGGMVDAERTAVLNLSHSPSPATRGMPCDPSVYDVVGRWQEAR